MLPAPVAMNRWNSRDWEAPTLTLLAVSVLVASYILATIVLLPLSYGLVWGSTDSLFRSLCAEPVLFAAVSAVTAFALRRRHRGSSSGIWYREGIQRTLEIAAVQAVAVALYVCILLPILASDKWARRAISPATWFSVEIFAAGSLASLLWFSSFHRRSIGLFLLLFASSMFAALAGCVILNSPFLHGVLESLGWIQQTVPQHYSGVHASLDHLPAYFVAAPVAGATFWKTAGIASKEAGRER